MQRILSVESDRRTVNITINSFNIELSKEQRAKLFPAIGNQTVVPPSTLPVLAGKAEGYEINLAIVACHPVIAY
ncbi:hypothetical protein D9758_015107 [Tetrapyrgos nigripes]|uniref:Uncharacterized protein n=1 Tax=Tetrapyrgos nigripes TaxID=182062 RepID=A0A8H5BZM4_9AGAR|nr:hypothetical protein D9758_015107 [Tetrapyrgos nigripes]